MRNTKVPFWLNTDFEAMNTEWSSAIIIVTPNKSHKNLGKCLLKLLQYSYIILHRPPVIFFIGDDWFMERNGR